MLEKFLKGSQKACLLGQVDIVNDYLLVEIKSWSNYRDALGQIMVYSHYFPDRVKMIIYFGEQPENAAEIKNIAENNGIIALDVSEL
jgi:hypothetical protein